MLSLRNCLILLYFGMVPTVVFFYFFHFILNYIDVKQYTRITVSRDRRGRDRMVVGFTNICAISPYHH